MWPELRSVSVAQAPWEYRYEPQMQPRSQGPLGGQVGEDPGNEVAPDVMLVHYSG